MEEAQFQTPESPESCSFFKKLGSWREKTSLREVLLPAGVILAIIFAGGVSGYLLANRSVPQEVKVRELIDDVQRIEGPKEVGIKDERVFRDTTQGRIEINDGKEVPEGSHRLIRPGGESQTAYLTSSVVDLNQFLGKCVQVWGETFAAQKAGWLMDVGRVKILDSCPEGL